jgi:hypothetical protein
VKSALDHVICVCMNEPGLEFVWVGDDAVDPLEQAQTLQILVGAGIKTREEARAELGLGPQGAVAGGKGPAAPVAKRATTRSLLGKYNPHRDERGQFSTADSAAGPVGKPERRPQRTPVQDAMMSDAGSQDVAQIEPPPIEPPPPAPEPETSRPQGSTPATPTNFSLEDIEAGKFPGVATRLGTPRTMPASDDPASAAQSFIRQLTTGRDYVPVATDLDTQGGYVFQLADGTYITYRPPGVSSERTESTTANVDINTPQINAMNGGQPLRLNFPKK